MISKDKITEIFCSVDDFCLIFDPALQKRQLSTGKKRRKRKFKISTSEIVTITVLFHLSGFRTFKHFYISYVSEHLNQKFPNTVSYNRFVELMQANTLPLTFFSDINALLLLLILKIPHTFISINKSHIY